MKLLTLVAFTLFACSAAAQDPQLSPNAPQDRPVTAGADRLAAFEAAIAPHVAEAKRTYPDAKRKFLAGLPKGQSFFITTRLHDDTGAFEQVFIAVHSIESGEIRGKVWSEINTVRGYRFGDEHRFPETDMIDWLITHPDGSEEGNFVGKFLDSYRGR